MKNRVVFLSFVIACVCSLFSFGFDFKKTKKTAPSAASKLLGKWSYNYTIDLVLNSDGTYVYGNYNYNYPKQIMFDTPAGCSDYNIWYETGTYAISGDRIAFTVEKSRSYYNNLSVKLPGDKDYWTYVFENDGGVTFLCPRWSRTFKRN